MIVLLPWLTACGSLTYYAQSVQGQLGVLAASRPVEQVLADPQTPVDVEQRLEQLPQLRDFAQGELGLVSSSSYRSYADVGREALVWSVVAAPADSLQPRQWCYPVLGCASYRGYFSRQAAQAYALELARQGWDVAVEPVPAYSTLGWFSDPLPSTVIHWPLTEIAGLIFHELAHETLYVTGDSAFNEAYASVVEQEGVRRWVARHGSDAQRRDHAKSQQRREGFLGLLAATRERLLELYAAGLEPEVMRARKAGILAELRAAYAQTKAGWGGYSGYDRWFDRPLNNAHFASLGTYHGWEPAFRQILANSAGDMAAFHEACRRLADLPEARREARMQAMLDVASAR